MRSCVCIIPARGGSKRLPRKNILPFHGKPMICWTIESAINSECFNKIIVSSEDDEVKQIASAYANLVIADRDQNLASDSATVSDVLLDILNKEDNDLFDIICCLFPASPLRTYKDVQTVVNNISPGEIDFSIAVTDYDLPPHQALKIDKNNQIEPMFPELVNLRDEKIGRLVVDNGSTYAASVTAFNKQKNFYGQPAKAHYMPRERSVDINYQIDLELADFYFQKSHQL